MAMLNNQRVHAQPIHSKSIHSLNTRLCPVKNNGSCWQLTPQFSDVSLCKLVPPQLVN